MNEQAPSIGRIVHYRDKNGIVMPAMIHTVHGNDCVSLHVFVPFDAELSLSSSVVYEDPTSTDKPTNDRWFWPPRV